MSNQRIIKKRKKQAFLFVTSSILVVSTVAPSFAAASASDIQKSTHKEAISALMERGIIKGYPDGTFKPAKSITRGDVVKMLGKFLVEQYDHTIPANYKTKPRFSDIALNNDEMLKYAAVVYDTGIFVGSNGKLDSKTLITRENIALVLDRLVAYLMDLNTNAYVQSKGLSTKIKDLNKSKLEARGAIRSIEYYNLTVVENYRPKETTTRGQFASFLYRLLTNVLENDAMQKDMEDYKWAQKFSPANLAYNESTGHFIGRGTAGLEIEVKASNGDSLGRAVIGADGTVIFELNRSLKAGEVLTFIVKDGQSSKQLTYTVPGKVSNPDEQYPQLLNDVLAIAHQTAIVPVSTDGAEIPRNQKWTTQAEKDRFEKAITDAEAVARNNEATAEQLKNVRTDLINAIETYNDAKKDGKAPAVEEVDTSALSSKLNEANNLVAPKISTNGSDVDPTDVWVTEQVQQAFVEAKQQAAAVLANPQSTQAQIDAAVEALNTAITTYISATANGTKVSGGGGAGGTTPPQIDKSALQQAITQANAVDRAEISADGTDVVYGEKWVTQAIEDTFSDALVAANAVLSNPTATQAQVSDAQAALTAAITTYNNEKNDGTFVDKSALQIALSEATDLVAATLRATSGANIPVTSQWAPPYAYDQFNRAITAANTIFNKPLATPTEVADELQNLQDKMAQFEAEIKNGMLVDVTALQSLVDEVDALFVAVSQYDGYDVLTTDQWTTPEEKRALTDALQAAKDVVANSTSTTNPNYPSAATVQQVFEDLQQAIETYEANIKFGKQLDFTQLDAKIVEAQNVQLAITSSNGRNVNPSDEWVTELQQTDFANAIQDAIDTLNDIAVTPAQLSDAITTLTAAITTYEAAKQLGLYADKTDLIAKVNEAERAVVVTSTNGKDVLPTNKWVDAATNTTFTEAIGAAITIIDNEMATPTEVNTAKDVLEQAITAYEDAKKDGIKATSADKADLFDALQAANAEKIGISVSNDGKLINPNDSWVTPADQATLQQVIDAAVTLYNKSDATQDEVQQATADVIAATADYIAAQQAGNFVNKEDLNAAINTALNTAPAIISLNGGDVNPGDDWVTQALHDTLQVALATAQALYVDEDADQTAVDAAESALTAAVDAYNAGRGNGSENSAELKEALMLEITKAQSELTLFHSEDGMDVRSNDTWVTAQAAQAFDDAITEALAAYNTVNITSNDLNAAILAIQAAIDAHDPQAGLLASTSSLQSLNDKIQDALAVSYIVSNNGYNVDTSEKWVDPNEQSAYEEAKQAAITLANKPDATEVEVNEAITDLEDAIAAYTAAAEDGKKANKTALELAVTDANAVTLVTTSANGENVPVTQKWVTNTAQQEYTAAKQAAQQVLNNEFATQQQVDDAVATLTAAIAAYEGAQADGLFVDRTALSEKLALANATVQATVSSTGTDVQVGKKWVTTTEQQVFNDAKASALATLNKPVVTAQEIADATANIVAATAAYEAAKKLGTAQPDKAALQAKYDELTQLDLPPNSVDGTDIPSAADWTTTTAKATFAAALSTADAVLQSTTKSQAEINAALDELNDAYTTFKQTFQSGTKPLVNTVNLSYEEGKVTTLTELNGVTTNSETLRTSFLSGQGFLTASDISFSGDQAPPLYFDVIEGEQLDLQIELKQASLATAGIYEVALYKLDEATGNYDVVESTKQSYTVAGALNVSLQSKTQFAFEDIGPGKYIVLSTPTIGGGFINTTKTKLINAQLTQSVEAQNVSAGPISGTIALGNQSKVTAVTPTTMGTAAGVVTPNETAVIVGAHGVLHMQANGQYTYTTQGNLDDIGKVDEFTFDVQNGTNTTSHKLYIRHDLEGVEDALIWDSTNLSADGKTAIAEQVAANVAVSTISNTTTLVGETAQVLDNFTYGDAVSQQISLDGKDSVLAFKIHATNIISSSATKGKYEVVNSAGLVVHSGTFTKTDHGREVQLTGLNQGNYQIKFKRETVSGKFGIDEVKVTNVSWKLDNDQIFEDDLPIITSPDDYTGSGEIFMAKGSKLKINNTTLNTMDHKRVEGLYGYLTLNGDGSYTYEVDRQKMRAAFVDVSTNYVESFAYEIAQANGEVEGPEEIVLTLTFANAPVNPGVNATPVSVASANIVPFSYTVLAAQTASTVDFLN